MYQNQAPQGLVDTSHATALDSLVSTTFNLLNSQESTILGIEERLHRILNKATPVSNSKGETAPAPVDFAQRINQEIYRLEAHNRKLELILSHLAEII